MKLAVLSAESMLVQCESGEDLKVSSNSSQRVTGQDRGEVYRHEGARPLDSL